MSSARLHLNPSNLWFFFIY